LEEKCCSAARNCRATASVAASKDLAGGAPALQLPRLKSSSRSAIAPFLRKIDKVRLREIQSRYADSPEKYAKYADLERWLARHLENVRKLGLDRSSPKSIVDLGCGGGFFLFLCQQFGHDVRGVDVDEFPLFGELLDLLGVPRTIWRIEAMKPLPDLGRKFDWITAFSTRFNRDAQDRHVWSEKEWNFFLDDVVRHLAPGGQVFFEINSGKTRDFYPNELRELFRNRGAQLERDYVLFANGVQ
jgi:SAM-dependent methyltransferase